MSVTALTTPVSGCNTNNESVTVTLKNNGSALIDFSVNNVTITSSVSGTNPMSFPPFVVSSGTLAPNATMNVVVFTGYDMSAAGGYTFSASSSVTGDGNSSNDAMTPVTLVSGVTTTASSTSNICIGSSGQLFSSPSPAASGATYSMFSIPYAPLSGTSAILSGYTSSDDGYKTIPLPFTFSFFGTSFSSVNVETNGYLSFGAGSGSRFVQTLPNTTTPNNLIAICWADMNVTGAGSIDTFRVGTAPFRKFVVRFNTVPFYSNNPPGISGQIILYETSNIIDVMVTQLSGSTASRTLGIENAGGTVGYSPTGHNNANWSVSTPEGWRFSPVVPAYTYLWTPNGPGSGINTGNETQQNPLANPTTTTTYTVTVTNGACSTTATTTITVNPLPSVTASGAATFCSGGNTVLSASGANTYVWSPATGLSSTTVSNPTASPTVTTTYTVTGSTTAGCTGTATVTVTVNPNPTVTVTGTTTICNGGSTTLTASSSAVSYSWSPASSLSNNTIANPVASPTTTTTYTVVGTTAAGCTGQTTKTVTVNPLPTVTVSGVTTICNGSNTTLTANGANSYLWSPATGLSNASIANPVASPTTTTTYTVTGTTAAGCTGSTTVMVTVNPLPTVTITGTNVICTGSNTTLTANGAASFVWSPATGLSSTTIANPVASPTATTTYTVTGTGANGCTANATVTVTVNPLPVVNLGSDITQCGGNVNLDAQNAGSTYAWSTSATTQSISVSSTGNYSVVVTNANGCSNSDAINVTINTPPTVALGTDITQCGGTAMLDAGNAGSTYAWSESSTTQTITVSSSGTYSVLVTDANGCTGTDAIDVTINTPPTVALGTDITQCGGTAMLDAGNAGSTYAWSESSTTQTITVSSSGTYSVLVTDANGCTGTDAIDVIINTPPIVALGTDITQCGGTAMLDAGNAGSTYAWSESSTTQTITVSSSGTYSVLVTDANGCTGTDAIDVIINTPPTVALGPDVTQCGGTVMLDAGNSGMTYLWSETSTTQTITVATGGTYSVVVTDANGCTGTDAIDVVINALPVVNLGSDITQCGGNVTLDAQNAGSTYLWSDGSTTQTIVVGPGTYDVTVTDGNSCSNSDTINVTINPNPTPPALGNDTTICSPDSVLLDAGPGYDTYNWSTGATTQSIFATSTGSYMVTVSNIFGCTSMSMINVTVNICTGVSTSSEVHGIELYPNPSTGMVYLSTGNDLQQMLVEIVDMNGQLVYSSLDKEVKKGFSKEIDLQDIANGVYSVRINTGTSMDVKRLVIQK
jgi:hypothetical protein